MIYLIDDNRYEQQQKLYHADYLFDGSFKSELTSIYKVKLVDYRQLEKTLENASLILIHNTFADADEHGAFLDNSRRIRDFIIEDLAEENDIPFVLFSGGISETTFDDEDNPNVITGINKTLFYSNLFPFLQHYKDTQQVELKLLAYGSEYKIHDAIKLVETILAALKKKDSTLPFAIKYINYVTFAKFYDLTQSKKTLDAFLDEVVKQDLTVGDFMGKLKKIKKSLIHYGKNIYD
jgi:hypothetical protein